MPFIRDPRELNIIRAEMQESSVTPAAKDESLPLFQQNLKVLTNMSNNSTSQHSESKSILSGIQQELKNIAANTRQSKEGLKEASVPTVEKGKDKESLQEIKSGLGVISAAKDESLPLFQQNLKVLMNMSNNSTSQHSESKSILSGIQQELKNIAANTRQSKEGLKEASVPTVEKGEYKESLREIKSSLGVISTAITTLVDLFSPIKEGFTKLLTNTEKQVQAAVLSNELSKTQHKLSAEASAKQHRENKALFRDLDEDLEYQTEVTRKKELEGSKKEGDAGRAEKAEGFLKNLFSLVGLKPVWDFLKFGVDFFKGGMAFVGLGWKAIGSGLTLLFNPVTGLVVTAGLTLKAIHTLVDLTRGTASARKYAEEKEKEIDAASRDRKKRKQELLAEKTEKGELSPEKEAQLQRILKTDRFIHGTREGEAAAHAETEDLGRAMEIATDDPSLGSVLNVGYEGAKVTGKSIYDWGSSIPDRFSSWWGGKEPTGEKSAAAGTAAVVGTTAAAGYAGAKTYQMGKEAVTRLLPTGGTPSTGGIPSGTPPTTTISKAAQEQLKHFDDLGKKVTDVTDDVLKQTTKTESYFARFYKTVKETTGGALKSVSEKAGKAVDYVRSGVGKMYTPVKDTIGKLTEKAGGALKGLGKRGAITLPKMPNIGGAVKSIAAKTGGAINSAKGVLKGVASKIGPIVAAGLATHEASGLAGEGDYLGAAKALAKGGISFVGGLLGGAAGGFVGTAAGPAGTVAGGVAGSMAGSMAAEKAADWFLGETRTKKDEVPETVGRVKSEENIAARKKETMERMVEARTERYNELLAEGKSFPEIKKIIQKEFKNINTIMAKENGVSESVIEESEKKTTDAIVELSSKTESLAEAKDKKDEINNRDMDSWLDRIYDFLKNDFISGIAGLLGITIATAPKFYSGTQNLQPKLGSAATPAPVENDVEPLPTPSFAPQQISAKTTEGTVPSPTVPSPTVPSPTVPSPTVPSPTVPSPTVLAEQPLSLAPEISTGLAAVQGIMPQDMQAAMSSVMPAQPQAPATKNMEIEKKPDFQEVVSAEANLSAPNIENRMEAVAPLPSGFTKITSPYGPRKDVPPGASTDHKAIDIGAPTGTPVFSIMDGKVTGLSSKWGGVYIAHDNGLASQYLHMSRFNVGSGQKVKRGDVIGLSGATQPGTIKGMKPHLHLGLTQNGSKINPLPFLQSQAGFSPTYANKDIERRALSAAGTNTAQETAKKLGASSVIPGGTEGAAAQVSPEGMTQPGEQGLIASGIEKATGLGKTAFETMMSLGATTATSIAGMIPDKYLPKDMKASLEKMKTNKTADWTTAAGQFTNDPNWHKAGMGEDISGMRMGMEERVKAITEDATVKAPATVSPATASPATTGEIAAAPVTAPAAAQVSMENNTGAQMKQIMSGFTQSMAAMQSAMAGAGAGGSAQVSSSGPMIDDISLQMLQKFFLGD